MVQVYIYYVVHTQTITNTAVFIFKVVVAKYHLDSVKNNYRVLTLSQITNYI